MAKTLYKLQKQIRKVWLKLLKASVNENAEKTAKLEAKLIQLELEKHAVK